MQFKRSRYYLLFFLFLFTSFQIATIVKAESSAGSQAGISFTEKEPAETNTGTDTNSEPTSQYENSNVASSNLLPQTGSSAGIKNVYSFLFIVAGAVLYRLNVKQKKN